MHHTLRFYNRHRGCTLRLYMLWAKCTRIPLLGRLVRQIADSYGRNTHRAYLLTLPEAERLISIAGGVALGSCTCRSVFKNCENPVNAELLLGPSRHVLLETMPPDAREITSEAAKEILRDGHDRGLIHTILRCQGDFYAICNCCACCCVPLRLSKQYGIGAVLVRPKDIVQEFSEYQQAYRD
ncbi:MAG: hypothetical protein A2144_03360 [Chloroflexi bacterium RBG_16_50_9]|nr:MAG: hypothetical protein A2144_03360 [Chloroflexi bacterium RBG_16_50_9]